MPVAARMRAGSADSPERPGTSELRHLYEAERSRLVCLAAMLVGDHATAEDVVQDAFAAVHRRWQSLDHQSGASAYLSACVVNGARSVLRRRRTALRRLRAADPEDGPPADAALMLAEDHCAVVAAVRRLPRRQQQVIVLRYWLGLTEAQIAQALRISRGSVKSAAARGLARVKERLEANDER